MAALTAGALSQVSVSDIAASLASAAATGGTTPYTYQWYRAVSGATFTPGGGNILTGKTALTLSDTGLTPGTIYFYRVVTVDTASGTPNTVTSTGLAVTSLVSQPNQNQFAEAAYLGMTDLRFNANTLPVIFDPAGSGTLVGGQAVKWSTTVSGTPMVVPSLLQADVVAGFVNYNMKDLLYNPGDALEISMAQNVMYLRATAAINRGGVVVSMPSAVAGGTVGGVQPSTGSLGFPVVGYALDTVVSGALVRIMLTINPWADYVD